MTTSSTSFYRLSIIKCTKIYALRLCHHVFYLLFTTDLGCYHANKHCNFTVRLYRIKLDSHAHVCTCMDLGLLQQTV